MGSQGNQPRRYLIKIWYIGAGFSGSQRQPNKRTVEGELLQVLKEKGYFQSDEIFNFKTATRTDAGVHANETVFSFSTEKTFYPNLIDQNLHDDMGIYAWANVPLDFNPRFETAGKEYHYILPIEPNEPIDFPQIQAGLEILKGTHDFRLLAKKDLSKKDRPTTPTITRAEFESYPNYLKFIFQGDYFLWEQIRRMVGFLYEIGTKFKTLNDLEACFLPENYLRDHPQKIKPAPAEGLTLMKIHFPEHLEFNIEYKAVIRMQKSLKKYYMTHTQQAGAIYSILEQHKNVKK